MSFNIITPSSRGLSLALARQLLLKTPHPLIATARQPDLSTIKQRILSSLPDDVSPSRLTVLRVDVTDAVTLSRAAEEIRRLHPNASAKYIFSTAGVLYPERSPQALKKENIQHTLETNILGPLLVLKHFSPLLSAAADDDDGGGGGGGGVWVNISARVGSITDNRAGGWYSYRASKAALNSITKTFDLHLQQKGRGRGMAVAVHPGTVKTELSREFWGSVPQGKLFEPEYAAERVLETVMRLREEDRGLFWDWKGERIEW
jgi:NAD(P)-dependent dehydrogenase (short-subunit alcohol dehydrogenase family)